MESLRVAKGIDFITRFLQSGKPVFAVFCDLDCG
jgi:hypothetical protein